MKTKKERLKEAIRVYEEARRNLDKEILDFTEGESINNLGYKATLIVVDDLTKGSKGPFTFSIKIDKDFYERLIKDDNEND